MPITPLPTPPSRAVPSTFSAQADAFLNALPAMATEINAVSAEIEVNSAIAAGAGISAIEAAASAAAAQQAANVSAWVSGITYTVGQDRWSLVDFLTYRRITNGAGTTDPKNDSANWKVLTPVVVPPTIIRSARISNTILGIADSTKLIDITSGTFTQTFDAAATLGDGWYCYIRNSGTGDITLDPNASELIDGLASYIMYPGECRLVQCDGAELRSVVLNSFYRVFTASGTFVNPPGYTAFEGLLWGGGGSGAKYSGLNGGGGGACVPFMLDASRFGTSQSVVIAAGGIGPSTEDTIGADGGRSNIGVLVNAYGAGGGSNTTTRSGAGGGAFGAGVANAITGGIPLDGPTFGGAASATTNIGSNSVYGGASGAVGSGAGGTSLYGGGGGGTTAGASSFGGAGGVTSSASSGTNGLAPGGGGGATSTGAKAGDGARGELRIWGLL